MPAPAPLKHVGLLSDSRRRLRKSRPQDRPVGDGSEIGDRGLGLVPPHHRPRSGVAPSTSFGVRLLCFKNRYRRTKSRETEHFQQVASDLRRVPFGAAPPLPILTTWVTPHRRPTNYVDLLGDSLHKPCKSLARNRKVAVFSLFSGCFRGK
jgi:hypothetical protein